MVQLGGSAVFYFGTEIINQHLTHENRIALSSVDAGFVVRQESNFNAQQKSKRC